MISPEFVAPYQREIGADRWPKTLPELMQEARRWSHCFGVVLHDYLSDADPRYYPAAQIHDAYYGWVAPAIQTFEKDIAQSGACEEEKAKAQNEFNFHRLNTAMNYMWLPIGPAWTEDPPFRRSAIEMSQDLLALGGLQFYIRKEGQIKKQGPDYFNEETEFARSSLEGLMHEFDAGIVLLECIKREPHLTIVPGPMQFEYSRSDQASQNADFVVIDNRGRAVGVQIKSSVSEETIQQYDPDRIVLIDARLEFGNEKAFRTDRRKSKMSIVSWAGMICAARVHDIRIHGNNFSLLRDMVTDQQIISMKMHARQLLAGTKSNLPSAVDKVKGRVLGHL